MFEAYDTIPMPEIWASNMGNCSGPYSIPNRAPRLHSVLPTAKEGPGNRFSRLLEDGIPFRSLIYIPFKEPKWEFPKMEGLKKTQYTMILIARNLKTGP